MTQAIVDAARAWIGTPYLHQASLQGAGSDCLGLLRGVWRACLGCEPMAVPAYTADWSEPSRREDLFDAANQWLIAKDIGDEAPGDVLLFRMRIGAVAKHLGIVGHTGADASFVHAYTGHGVLETALTAPWRRKIAARYCFPERI